MRRQLEAFVQIEAMGVVPAVTGIKMNLVTLQAPGLFDDPIQKCSAQSVALLFGVRNQVVDVEHPAPREKVQDAIARRRRKHSIEFEKNHAIPFRVLGGDLFAKLGGGQMRAQIGKDGEGALHVALVVDVEELNQVFHYLDSPMR